MLFDSPPSILPCTDCGAVAIAQCVRTVPCEARVRDALMLDVAIAVDLRPATIPLPVWDAVVRHILVTQTGPTGQVLGGVLHVLGALGGFRAAQVYYQARASEPAFVARTKVRKLRLGGHCPAVFDAIDIYCDRAQSEELAVGRKTADRERHVEPVAPSPPPPKTNVNPKLTRSVQFNLFEYVRPRPRGSVRCA